MRELGPPDPARVAALPSTGRLAALGALAVLGPGVLVFLLAHLAGVSDGGAGSLGLLAMLVGMAGYPFYLRRLGRRVEP